VGGGGVRQKWRFVWHDLRGGGANNDGTVFEIVAGSNTISTLASFNNTDGAEPVDAVTLDGEGDIYGTTQTGGADNLGTVFEIAQGSGTITTLVSFNEIDGDSPHAGLVMDSHGNLYGTTLNGGPIQGGIVFEIPSGSNSIQTVASLNTNADGIFLEGGVLLDGNGNLYGTTISGGAYNSGTIFEIQFGSNAVTPLASFNTSTGDGGAGTLIMDSHGNLFGIAAYGGESDDGTVYELAKGGNSISSLFSFDGDNGATPWGGLVMDSGGNLFGTAQTGGDSGYEPGGFVIGSGTIFEVPSGASSPTTLSSLFAGNANYSLSGLTVDRSGNLYGASLGGGALGLGAIFEVAAGSNTISTLASFNEISGIEPTQPLTLAADGNLYGTTPDGGANNVGTVFEFDTATNSIIPLASFNGSFGLDPTGAVAIDSGGNIFGATERGGPQGDGSLWELASGGNTITDLALFNAANATQGVSPMGSIALDSSGNIYGTTEYGGPNSDGTVFELANGGNSIITLASFNGANGALPEGGIALDGNGNLYGTTFGIYTQVTETVFEVAQGSGTITTLASFNAQSPVYSQSQLIVDAAGNLFGATPAGPDSEEGIVFEVAKGANSVTTLAAFNGPNGRQDYGPLAVDANGDLFGATEYGGITDSGVVFELPGAATVAPAITSFTVNGGAAQRSMVTQATVTFNQPVNLATGAISLVQRATGGGTPTLIAFVQSSTDNTTWNLTFPGYTGGSLPDGVFDLTVTAADVTRVSSPTLAMSGGDQTFTFDRLFGDVDGNGIVNNAEYFQFKKSFGQLAGGANYNAAFDFDANGVINNADYFQFKQRFGQQIIIGAQSSDSSDAALLSSSDTSSNHKITAQILRG
jgi:uncharacterized repeat protein (TIGR03803 family)